MSLAANDEATAASTTATAQFSPTTHPEHETIGAKNRAGVFGFFSKSCASLSNFVQSRNRAAEEKARAAAEERERTKNEEFLADIDNLNRNLQRRDKAIRGKRRMDRPQARSAASGDYVSMGDTGKEPTADGLMKDDGIEPTQGPEGSETETKHGSLLDFFWELLAFAKNRSWKKKVMTVLVVAISFYVIIDLLFLGYIMILIEKLLEWMTEHPGGAVICFLGFFVFATLFFVPPTILYFGAGYAFYNIAGFWGGFIAATVVCFIGSTLGAVLAFLRSRYMMRDLVELFAKRFPIVKCLDEAMRTEGFKAMILLRLCPIIPFNALNHIGGITQITLEEYTFATVGIIPNIILWVLVGLTTDHIHSTETDDTGEYILYIALMVGGVLFAAVGLFLLCRFARDALHKEIKAQRALSWHRFADTSTRTSDDFFDEGEEGLELIVRQPGGIIAVLGIDHHGVETASVPVDGHDEDWMWVWA